MRKIVFAALDALAALDAFAALAVLCACGCAVPAGIRYSLDVQARYTRIYVEATLPLLIDSQPRSVELRGIGKRLVRNADALKDWAEGRGKGSINSGTQPIRYEKSPDNSPGSAITPREKGPEVPPNPRIPNALRCFEQERKLTEPSVSPQ